MLDRVSILLPAVTAAHVKRSFERDILPAQLKCSHRKRELSWEFSNGVTADNPSDVLR